MCASASGGFCFRGSVGRPIVYSSFVSCLRLPMLCGALVYPPFLSSRRSKNRLSAPSTGVLSPGARLAYPNHDGSGNLKSNADHLC